MNQVSKKQVQLFIEEYHNSGSLNKVAKKYNYSTGTIRYHLVKHGVIIKGQSKTVIKNREERMNMIIKDYKAGYSVNEIAARNNFSIITVKSYIKEYNIKSEEKIIDKSSEIVKLFKHYIKLIRKYSEKDSIKANELLNEYNNKIKALTG